MSTAIGNATASVRAVTRKQLAAIVLHERNDQRNAETKRAHGVSIAFSILNVSEYGGARVLISSCCTRTHTQEMMTGAARLQQVIAQNMYVSHHLSFLRCVVHVAVCWIGKGRETEQ